MQASSNIEVHEPEENESRGTLSSVFGSLGGPLILGLAGFWGFLLLLQFKVIQNELLIRYLSAHPVSYVATAMFFVGVAGLGLKLVHVIGQIVDLDKVRLSEAPALAQRPESSRRLLDELDEMPTGRQRSWMGMRLRNALEFVDRSESANGLDDELKYLSDLDGGKQHESYSLIRILIWAIPMLGFLGTVVGISGALGGLSVAADFETMLAGLRDKLYVAFDTTALALTLSIVLMFAQFVVNRIETQHLSAVDESANDELIGRFETFGGSRDPYLSSVENMARRVTDTITNIAEKQSQAWDNGVSLVRDRTDDVLNSFGESLTQALTDQLQPIMQELGGSIRQAVAESGKIMDSHSDNLTRTMETSLRMFDQRNEHLLELMDKQAVGLQNLMDEQADGLKSAMDKQAVGLKNVMEKQNDVLQSAFEHSDQVAASHVKKLEQTTEKSLSAIEHANQFMEKQADSLQEVVMVSAKLMEDHSNRISEAVNRSEEMVDKRQESIAKTQESILKVGLQQSMALSQFTERLEVLQQTVEQAQSLEQMQGSLRESMLDLQQNGTLMDEIKGLGELIREQVQESATTQSANAAALEERTQKSVQQVENVVAENGRLFSEFQNQQQQLVAALMANQESIQSASLESASLQSDRIIESLKTGVTGVDRNFEGLGQHLKTLQDQIAHQHQALRELTSQVGESPNLEAGLRAVVERLDGLQLALTQPTEHQRQFLEQQKQTLANQNELLDFCQSVEVNNRSGFLDTAQEILTQHADAASKAVELEQTVQDLTFSINLLNQSLAKQSLEAAQSAMQFHQPEVPKRVA